MELRHLKYFISVAQHLNFSEAAKQLNISQPPLSRQIQQLEEELSVKLLTRTNRHVELTEAGTHFLESAKRTLNLIDYDILTAQKIHEGETGVLTIGFGGSVVFDLLPKVIKRVRAHYPNLQLNLRQLTTTEQITSLLNGTIDVGILVPPVDNQKINTIPIREEAFVVCVPNRHPLSTCTSPIAMKEFTDENIIMTPKEAGKGYYDAVLSLCRQGGFFPKITQTAQEQQTLVSLVAAELGVAFVPESTKLISHKNVKYLSLQEKQRKISAVAWNNEYSIPTVKLFTDILFEGFTE